MTLIDDRVATARPQVFHWIRACAHDRLIPGRGAAVLLPDRSQVALFVLDDGSLHAIGNIDPFTGAAVLSRGIVGDRGGRACVQSPIKKQAFAFDDGACLDDPSVSVAVYPVRLGDDGYVEVGSRASNATETSSTTFIDPTNIE